MNKFDYRTQKWFKSHPDAETTVVKCTLCGCFYKPILGHKCRASDIKKHNAGLENLKQNIIKEELE